MTTEKFEQWVLLELFGHNKIAGLATERNIAGGSFLQVDVPETKSQPAFTRLLNPSAIYAVNPITEEVAKLYAENLGVKPIESWDIRKFMEKVEQKKLELSVGKQETEDNVNPGYHDTDQNTNSGEYRPGEEYDRRHQERDEDDD
jgi:hypothetical protein